MIARILSEAIKIILDPLQDNSPLTLAKSLRQPCIRFRIVFAVIAAVCAMTKRDNVSRDCAGAMRTTKRYPMIHSQGMPKSLRASTNGAATVEVTQSSPPIVDSKRVGQFSFSRLSLVAMDTIQLWVRALITATDRPNFISVFPVIIAPPYPQLIFTNFILLLRVFLAFFGVIFIINFHAQAVIFGVFVVFLLAMRPITFFAPIKQAVFVFSGSRKVIGIGQQLALTLVAFLKGIGDVKHLAPQLCWLNMMLVARVVLSATSSGATLDYPPIIAQLRGNCQCL